MSPTQVLYAADDWGVGELWFDGSRLLQHELPAAKRPVRVLGPVEGVRGSREVPPTTIDQHLLVDQLRRYFRGQRVDFSDARLDLDWCTPFQRAVASVLRTIPYGEVVTYGELAALAGHPNAYRAVGTFCARNRFSLVLPCHRVIGADGIGLYGSLGVGYKRRLLALERVAF